MKVLSIIGIVIFSLFLLVIGFNLVSMTVLNVTGECHWPAYYFYANAGLEMVFGLGLTFSIITFKKYKKNKTA